MVLECGEYEVLIDVEDFDHVGKFGVHRIRGNLLVRLTRKVNGSRCIANAIMGKPPKGFMWDHINNDPFDNRKLNLRLVTRRQNLLNRRSTTKTGFKGVYLQPRCTNTPYHARIMCNGKIFYLGNFATAELAHEAYCKKAFELHGQYANFGQMDN